MQTAKGHGPLSDDSSEQKPEAISWNEEGFFYERGGRADVGNWGVVGTQGGEEVAGLGDSGRGTPTSKSDMLDPRTPFAPST